MTGPRARAKALADRLAGATDALNARLREAEAALNLLQLGVPGRVPLYEDADGPVVLVFTKRGTGQRGFSLGVESRVAGHVRYAPLTNATRRARLAAAERLDELLDRLFAAAEAEAAAVEAAGRKTEAFASDVREAARKRDAT